MPRTAEAIVDASGQIRLLESLPLHEQQRVLVTVLDEDAPSGERSSRADDEVKRGDMIARLTEAPLQRDGFEPISREEAHQRT